MSRLHYRFSDFTVMRQFAWILILLSALCSTSAIAARAQDADEDSEDAIAVFNQAQVLHEKGDLIAAIELYKKALKIVPEFAEAEYQCGTAYLSLGRRAEAESAFRRSIELRPDWTLALTSLGSILLDNGNLSEAESALAKAIELDDQNFPALAAMAELRLRTKAPAPVLQKILEKLAVGTGKAKPTASLWTARAALENALGNRDAARLSLANALRLDPKSRFALTESAKIALADGDTVRASETVTQLEKLAPDASATRLLRARVLAVDGQLTDAVKMLDSIKDDIPEVKEFRSIVRAASSDNVAELDKQLVDEPKNAVMLGRLCSLNRIDAPAKALDYCRRAAEAEPTNINHAIGFGAALVQAKMYEQAIGLFRKLLAVAPDNSTAHVNLATALFQLKRYAEAKVEYQWLVSKQPDLAVAYYFLAITHDQLAEYLDSMANYQQFLRLADPAKSQLEIDKVNLRLPILQRQIKEKKGRKSE